MSDKLNGEVIMKTAEAIKIIYTATSKKLNPEKGREMVAVTIQNIISDLVDAGKFTPENFESEMAKEAEYFLKTQGQEAA